MKQGIVLFKDILTAIYFTVLWYWTYGKRPFRYQDRKPAAATIWATLFD